MATILLQVGCASYQLKVDESRRLFKSDPASALEKLAPLASEESRDQLVYMLDYATTLQAAGRYEESARTFLQAEKLADLNDYHSVSRVAGSLALSEEMVQYKVDDFEKVLIPSMNALNYLELSQGSGSSSTGISRETAKENAMTQARKVNEVLTQLRIDEKKDFNQSPYAYYLAGLLYEDDRDFDNALILYKKAFEFAPEYRPLRKDLIRASILAQRPDELEKFKKQFPEIAIDSGWRDRKLGEVVLIFLQGWGPRKAPRPENHRFPYLVPVPSLVRSATLSLHGDGGVAFGSDQTQPIYSIQNIAIKALDADYGRLVASRIAGVATKAVLADQLRQKNEALGSIAWIAMNIMDRADLRQWSTLPETIQVARVLVKPGDYQAVLTANDGSRGERKLVVAPGRKSFLVWRLVD